MPQARLSKEDVGALLRKREMLSSQGDNPEWRHFHERCVETQVKIIVSVGTLLHPEVSGLVWAWQMTGAIRLIPYEDADKITRSCSLAEQGMIPLVEVRCTLGEALRFASEVNENLYGIVKEA